MSKSQKNSFFRIRSFFGLVEILSFLPLTIGCGLFASGKTTPRLEETPPFYSSSQAWQAEKEELNHQTKRFRQTELERLEEMAKEEGEERKRQSKNQETSTKKKNPWFSYSGNDDTFLRSKEAARIHSNLDR